MLRLLYCLLLFFKTAIFKAAFSGMSADITEKLRKKEDDMMTKDSQPDNKRARKKKSKGQTPITADAQNNSRTTKNSRLIAATSDFRHATKALKSWEALIISVYCLTG